MTDSARLAIIDNAAGNTWAEGVHRSVEAIRDQESFLWGIDVATGFFDVPGFAAVAADLEAAGTVRLLLGAELPPEASIPPPVPGDLSEPQRTRRRVANALRQLDTALAQARDRLPFDAATDRTVGQLLDFLGTGKVQVRRLEDAFLPLRALLFRAGGGGVLAGSANLSAAGLTGPGQLVLRLDHEPAVARMGEWFDGLWARAAEYDLAALYQRLRAEYPPYLIYLRVLLALYGAELVEEQLAEGPIPVTNFQRHGVWRALRILNEFGGVLIADGVGLGKTFLAGEIIRLYRERRQRVLLVCPAALRDSTWKDFLTKYQMFVHCLSYEQLARDRQFGGDMDELQAPMEEFALAVVDEAHNYRNPNAPARAGVLRRLMQGMPRRDLVLLSATPVNNSLWDLFHLLRYFIRQDAALAGRGVLSLKGRFEEAMKEDPFNLNPDLLYPVLDATTVKRTRHFVKKYYENDQVRLPDGRVEPIRFPRPVPSSINYSLDEVLPGFLSRLEAALMPPDGRPQLTLARYQPENYLKGRPVTEDRAVVGLIRSGLLKRFESSVHAFALSTGKMVQEHDLFLRGLTEKKLVLRKELLREWSAADEDDVLDELFEEEADGDPASEYDLARLRRDVEADRNLLAELNRAAELVDREHDPKLRALADELGRIARQADADGIDAEERRRDRKVLIFSFYEDTVDWIEGYLERRVEEDSQLAVYRGRIASVAGNESRSGVTRRAAVEGFAPESVHSSGTNGHTRPDLYDILVTTDVLAEGMNLQQCRNIINYDLPWNPMRLVQRHGRIDRIGSKHPKVFLRTVFPDRELDRLLVLEQRVRRKLAQAAASVGVEAAPIEQGNERDLSFAETREEIERLRAGNPSLYEAGGSGGAIQSGEEYRQELRRALQRPIGEAIRNLPWKAGSGLARGERRGHVFCAQVDDRTYLRFVPFGAGPADPIEHELGTCLRYLECQETTPRVVPADLLAGAYSAWERARNDIHKAWTRETDPATFQPRVGKLNRELAAFLRDNPPEGVDQARLTRCLDAIEAPVSRREENELRVVFNGTYRGNRAKAAAIVEAVEHLGLEPLQAPEPLPPIRREDVHLICWMAVEREGTPESATLKGRITKRSDVCGGDACIRDTRITVWGLVEWWKLGLSDSEILERVQGLKPDDLDTARAYYAEHPEEIDEAIRQNEEA